ncbi:hypothetical protein GCM10011309_23780 [Litorimonas cladophorae]|uniref:Membrane fusion protein biotin-lipoyl like domain-containing protein n=1 Tax=Litorimonas cladophorae TaxID=1220491 RepID=A0A918KTN4_9PROT|nr:HlyD family efflux transporter periplasmic adaptor subunit [Litorimonas cladophorae]GGX73095.1 hypothetical protein GCM10011309_23780 [Litorimonas cladophorae]
MAEPVKLRSVAPPEARRSRPSVLETLIRLEGEAIAATDALSLQHQAVNKPRDILDCGHIFWVSRKGSAVKILAVTGQEQMERHTPFGQWLKSDLKTRIQKGELNTASQWQFKSGKSGDVITYPFIHAFFAPFSPNPKSGGLLFAFAAPPPESHVPIMARLGEIYGLVHAARRGAKRARMAPRKRNLFLGTVGALALIGLIPIPMTTLAPAEVVADSPFILSAEFDGVIKDILVAPNAQVKAGDALVQLDDVTLRNELILAEKELQLSEVRRKMAGLRAFVDAEAKRELAVANAEADLAKARRDYAQERLDKTILRAPRDGLALFSDVSELTGQPVSNGEAILRIAEPTRVLLRLHAPLAHGEALREGARVRMFLDTDPVTPLEAELVRASYRAVTLPEGGMAFDAHAMLTDGDVPRIGARGVAKIYGEKAPLGYFLIRRPLTLFRQMTGL